MADSACRQTVDCQYNCYVASPDAGDPCANACPGMSGALFVAYNNCNQTTCGTQCLCPGP